jgi:hypothetical protein
MAFFTIAYNGTRYPLSTTDRCFGLTVTGRCT